MMFLFSVRQALLILTLFLFIRWHFPHFVPSLTNVSILMLNFTEQTVADDYLN